MTNALPACNRCGTYLEPDGSCMNCRTAEPDNVRPLHYGTADVGETQLRRRRHVPNEPEPMAPLPEPESQVRPVTSRVTSQVTPPLELTAFLDTADPEYDWLVPGLLERGDRLILTGDEGKGKSTLLRQIGMQISAGINPFTDERFDRRRVLLLDLENSARQIRRKLTGVHAALKNEYQADPGMFIEPRPEGLNLHLAEDQQYLTELVASLRPDLLITGPLYKLASGDPTEESNAKPVAMLFDQLRARTGMAIILEAHTPHAANGAKKRPERPYGASLWLRWPEFGLYLSEQGMLRHWRGQRDERSWPAALQRGGHLPWTVVSRPRDQLWARITELCIEAGGQLAERDLATHLGVSQMTVHRAIDEHRLEWAALAESHESAS